MRQNIISEAKKVSKAANKAKPTEEEIKEEPNKASENVEEPLKDENKDE